MDFKIKTIQLGSFLFALEDLAIRKDDYPLNNWEEKSDGLGNTIVTLPAVFVSKLDEAELALINEWVVKD